MWHSHYWSNSKIADIIRGSSKPSSETIEGWRDWRNQVKAGSPIRYWIAEEFLDMIQDIVCYIPNKINDVRYYLNNRFYTKTHSLTSKLSKGQWHEYDERILHCLFDEMVNFVEVEKAWLMVCWNDDEKAKYAVPLSRRKWWLRWFTEWRCPEAGLAYLDWESSLTLDEFLDKDDPSYGKPSPQALAAIELKELYNWWVNVRPLRPDPYDASGWSKHCDDLREKYPDDMLALSKTVEEKDQSSIYLNHLHTLEDQYEKEDEEMLIRLVKLRRCMWT